MTIENLRYKCNIQPYTMKVAGRALVENPYGFNSITSSIIIPSTTLNYKSSVFFPTTNGITTPPTYFYSKPYTQIRNIWTN